MNQGHLWVAFSNSLAEEFSTRLSKNVWILLPIACSSHYLAVCPGDRAGTAFPDRLSSLKPTFEFRTS